MAKKLSDKTSQDAYYQRRKDIDTLFILLRGELEKRDDKVRNNKVHNTMVGWDTVGTLGDVRKKMMEMVASLRNQDVEDVEDFKKLLADERGERFI